MNVLLDLADQYASAGANADRSNHWPIDTTARLFTLRASLVCALVGAACGMMIRSPLACGQDTEEQDTDVDQAIDLATRAIARSPSNAEAYKLRASLWACKRNWVNVIEDCDKALDLDPADPAIYFKRGGARLNLSFRHPRRTDLERALPDFAEAIRLDPTNDEAYRLRGWTLRAMKRYDEAIRDLSKAIALNPKNGRALLLRARVHTDCHAFERAIDDLTMAIALLEDDFEPHFYRGYAHNLAQHFNLAVVDFDKALKLKPNSSEAYTHRGYAHLQLHNLAQAERDYTAALDIAPTNVGALAGRGWTRYETGDAPGAVADFSAALAENAGDRDSYRGRAKALDALGEFEREIDDLTRAIDLAPKDVALFVARGRASYMLNSYKDAIRDLDEAIRLDRRCVEAYEALSLLRGTASIDEFVDATAAIELATKAIDLADSKSVHGFVALAAAHARAGNFFDAERYQKRAIGLAGGEDDEPLVERLKLFQERKPYVKPSIEELRIR